MCGRYVLYLSASAFKSHLASLGLSLSPSDTTFQPRYNIAPTQTAPVLTPASGWGERHTLELKPMKWGVTLSSPTNTMQINTRSDTLAKPNSFWNPLKDHRCVVPANGFYEWLHAKQPHHVKPAAEGPSVFLFAGLYEPRTGTYTIITTSSSAKLSFLHDRMPAILDASGVGKWLDRKTGWHELQKLLLPWDGEVEVYPVPKEVGTVGNDSPTFVERVSERRDGIRAGLEKQREIASASPRKKRKAEDEAPASPSPVKTQEKTEDVDEPPPTPTKTKRTFESVTTSNATNRRSPKKPKKNPVSDGNKKITSYFKPKP